MPKQLVCKACNNRLNSRVDMPMARAFRGLLNLFKIRGSKHGLRDNAIPVLVSADGKEMAARFFSDGSLHPIVGPLTKKPVPTGTGELFWQFRARTEEEAQQFIQGISQSYSWKKLKIEPFKPKEVRIKELPIKGKFEPIYRGTAKTALNYLVWRRPELAHDPSLDDVKQFILNGAPEGKHPHLATTQEIFAGGQFSTEGLLPKHLVAVGSEGSTLRCTVALFGKLWFVVNLSETFKEPPFHLEHEFNLVTREHRIVDFWTVHPDAFNGVLAENSKSRIRYGEFPSEHWHHLHEISTSAGWVRCRECSSTAAPLSPTREEALKCHEAFTRNSKT